MRGATSFLQEHVVNSVTRSKESPDTDPFVQIGFVQQHKEIVVSMPSCSTYSEELFRGLRHDI